MPDYELLDALEDARLAMEAAGQHLEELMANPATFDARFAAAVTLSEAIDAYRAAKEASRA